MLGRIFKSVDGLTEADAEFSIFVLPQVVLRGIIVNCEALMNQVHCEASVANVASD